MTLLEKLKELSATTGRRNGNEDLGHWADREKHENTWVRDIALPALIAVAEAAKEYREACEALHATVTGSREEWDAHKTALEKESLLDAALAKLTEEV